MDFSDSVSLSDQGLHRDNNEDAFLDASDIGLWAVADGMGGHEAGEVASAIVIETLQQKIRSGVNLREAILQAHHAIIAGVGSGRGSRGMGSTVIALQSKGNSYAICWVGDSRAYLWSPDEDGGELQQVSTDHSYVQLLVNSGVISAEDAAVHPDRHIITQCLGSEDLETIEVDTLEDEWRPGQTLLLCSDGLSDEVSDNEIAQILCDHGSDLESAAQALMKRALSNGGHDNVTLQLVRSPIQPHTSGPSWPDYLPRISGHGWLDMTFYLMAVISLLVILFVALG